MQNEKSKRGFAAMSPEQRSAIASLGGRKSQEAGTAHRFTSEEAQRAGLLGGAATASKGSAYMAEIGRRGGRNSAIRRRVLPLGEDC